MPKRASISRRFLTTVLVIDIVDSTKHAARMGDSEWSRLLGRYRSVLRGLLKAHRGKEVDTAGDGFLSTFEAPASAISCALDAVERLRELGFEVRMGLHTGETEALEGGLSGIAVHIADRIAELARPGEVLVSNTVKDLVAGAEISFTRRGEHSLKGVPGKASLFAARRKQPARSTESAKGISIMIVDDHPMWRETLRKLLERSRVGRVAAEAGDGEEAVRLAMKAKPEVAIMDLDLPVMNGIEATRRLIETLPGIKVLVLAASDEKSRVVEAVKAGASGYLLKTSESAELVAAVRKVHGGELVFPPRLAEMVLGELRAPDDATPAKVLSLVVAGGSVLFRDGLAGVLGRAGFEILGLAGDGDELITMTESSSPDVVIVDAELEGSHDKGGIGVAEAMKTAHPELGVLILSEEANASAAVEILSETSKGVGYLLKDRVSEMDQLIDAIRRVASGGSVIDPEVAAGLAARRKARDPLSDLTDREREILALMAEGRSNQAIGERLFLTPKTVETHIGRIFTKLGLEPAPDDNRRVVAVLTYLRSV